MIFEADVGGERGWSHNVHEHNHSVTVSFVPPLRVFVSSTAYDLAPVREQLRTLINSLGHVAVLSDYSGVLYDPNLHTHKSCVEELRSCDVVVLIIGNRWGSQARPEFVDDLSVDLLQGDDASIVEDLVEGKHVSVTQLEALTAFQHKIPVFAFAERQVLEERRFYEANEELAKRGELRLPSGNDCAVAGYIVSFLRYLEGRASGNAVISFTKVEEIQAHLRSQWSAWLQRMLAQRLHFEDQQTLLEVMSERLEDLKTVLVATVPDADARRVASGIIRYRLLCEFLGSLDRGGSVATNSPEGTTLAEALDRCGVQAIGEVNLADEKYRDNSYGRTYLVMKDGRKLRLRMPQNRVSSLESDWNGFNTLRPEERRVIFDALLSERRPILFSLGETDAAEITTADIQSWLDSRGEHPDSGPPKQKGAEKEGDLAQADA
ncbi:DUF4062 domain-containing protein [Propioniciclava sinopodophylli]|uniref:DUF4062 domain-containing protein n=1 Tax=Propioniciclava sinopodophylli TaxID=1837344 RepID=A0A4Q9KB16_9ACTN|nr:DUF4062 domain-containing protein [Propioniciclava sinopodophylli]TBT82708.1 DUF4062 domain-containing protein [Propioniciclava sinopodophylli]